MRSAEVQTDVMASSTSVARAQGRVLTLRTSDGTTVCEFCVVAENPPRRLRGLLGRKGLNQGEGLLIRPTHAIHMWFMRFAIDAVFIDQDGQVLRIAEHLRPWRMAAQRGARCVLEIASGEAARCGLAVGDRLVMNPAVTVQ